MIAERGSLSVGIDTGGTFTDIVVLGDDGALRLAKVPSSNRDPALAVLAAVDDKIPGWRLSERDIARFVHGTTVATNAVLERKGARIGILSTAGFEDVIEIGRQNRKTLYQLLPDAETPTFLAPGARRRGVVERIAPDGSIVTELDRDSLARSVAELVEQGVDGIAVCFLFSYVNPRHERMARDHIARAYPGIEISLSSEVDPSLREYERSCATAFDAYVKPKLYHYLRTLEDGLATRGVPAPLQIMQSRGGVCSAKVARERPVRLFLSGPAAGVVAARAVGLSVNEENLITIDVGGTSSDISMVVKGQTVLRPEGALQNYSVRVPMVDVNAIGAGGGSIAWVDSAGTLRVGPESAGAQPGPACYGNGGTEPTVTDASVVLGYLDPQGFAGGSIQLDPALAAAAIKSRIADPLGMSVEQAALGIHRIVNAQMAEGVRLMSLGRGLDPRDFALVAFGGAGPLHAAAIAQDLGIRKVLVPRQPGVLSARGLLDALVEHEVSVGFVHNLAQVDLAALLGTLKDLDQRCAELMAQESLGDREIETAYFADVCFVGQSFHIEVPLDPAKSPSLIADIYEDYCALHEQLHGHHTKVPARIVNLRVVKRVAFDQPDEAFDSAADAATAGKRRPILLDQASGWCEAAIRHRATLAAPTSLAGPAIIDQLDTTTLVPAGWHTHTHDNGVLSLLKGTRP